MFLLRLRPLHLFLLLMLPVLLSGILQQAPYFAAENALRLQIISVNLSTIFACIFVAWIITLTVALAPGMASRLIISITLIAGMGFRALQDSWMIDELNANGRLIDVEDLEILSPIFIIHAFLSLFMLLTLAMLSVWLVRKEKNAGIHTQPLWLTVIQFLIFPVGLFWIQKRVQAVKKNPEPEI